jgi:aldehyde dehydrogenase (NAD+)
MAPLPSPPAPAPAIETMRALVQRGESRSLAWRIGQLDRLQRLLHLEESQARSALAADLGKPELEAQFELVAVRQELALTRRHLRRWMRPRSVGLPAWALPGRAAIHPEPLGCVLILGPWNYPLQLCLHPLVSALAAGNTAVLKPSEHAPHTANWMAAAVARHFDPQHVQVVVGDGEAATTLLEQRFDHIFFTGGGRVGRLVMAAAARHLTPVTLELGGKSPAIVLGGADPQTTARRLIWGKGLNAGQTCVAPDHLLVVAEAVTPLIEACAREIERLYGQDPLTSSDLGQIVNERQFERLEGLLTGARQKGQILLGGGSDRRHRRMEPTLIAVDQPEDDPLMQEEIFGPLMPLIVVGDLEDALARVRRAPHPLALYLFGGNSKERQQLLATTSSGSVGFNDVVMQAGLVQLPFGGVGESGLGSYHGETGFHTFSHQRSVLSRSFWFDLPFRYPPYAGKLPLVRRLLG